MGQRNKRRNNNGNGNRNANRQRSRPRPEKSEKEKVNKEQENAAVSNEQKENVDVFAVLGVKPAAPKSEPTPEDVGKDEVDGPAPEAVGNEGALGAPNAPEAPKALEALKAPESLKVPEAKPKPKPIQKTESRKEDVKKPDIEEPSKRHDPTNVTKFKFERKNEEIQYTRYLFNLLYGSKFGGLLNLIDPECRYAAQVGPAETFDADGVQKLVEKMKAVGEPNAWPFEKTLTTVNDETRQKLFRQLSLEIHEHIRFCLMLACGQRGYELSMGKRNERPISNVWGKRLDPLVELKTVLAVASQLEGALKSIGVEVEDTRFWADVKNYAEVVVPALETFDGKVLAENSIIDCMATIHGRKELGFEIGEEDVDEMLAAMADTEFCDFVPTVLHHPDVFTTAKQLKLIHAQLEKMSKLMDIRVKKSGIQAITHILTLLSPEAAWDLMEELKDAKLPMKTFGIDPETFEAIKGSEAKRANHFNLFVVALNKSENFTTKECVAALMCWYLCCPAFDVNLMIYKILSTKNHIKSSLFFDDKRLLINTLLSLPFQFREHLQIGDEFSLGEVTDNRDSMYFQVKNALRSRNETEFVERLECFVTCRPKCILSPDRIFRIFIKCVQDGESQKMAVKGLSVLERSSFFHVKFPNAFFDDLLFLAISKYSIPDEKTSEAKFKFLEKVFDIVGMCVEKRKVEIDIEKTMQRWNDLVPCWFSVLFLSTKFPVLRKVAPKLEYPWDPSNMWDSEQKGCNEKKYGILAKLTTAWPECSDIVLVEQVVRKVIPKHVKWLDVYRGMKTYAGGMSEVDEYTKKQLMRKYDEKIAWCVEREQRKKELEEQRAGSKDAGDAPEGVGEENVEPKV